MCTTLIRDLSGLRTPHLIAFATRSSMRLLPFLESTAPNIQESVITIYVSSLQYCGGLRPTDKDVLDAAGMLATVLKSNSPKVQFYCLQAAFDCAAALINALDSPGSSVSRWQLVCSCSSAVKWVLDYFEIGWTELTSSIDKEGSDVQGWHSMKLDYDRILAADSDELFIDASERGPIGPLWSSDQPRYWKSRRKYAGGCLERIAAGLPSPHGLMRDPETTDRQIAFGEYFVPAGSSKAVVEGFRAFIRDLPELYPRYAKQWVAYHGDRRIGIGAEMSALVDIALRDGLRESELAIVPIAPLSISNRSIAC